MRRTLGFVLFLGVMVFGIAIGGSIPDAPRQPPAYTSAAAQPAYTFHASSPLVTRDEQFAQADAVLVGIVTNVTPARFNQDSGAYWYEERGAATLPYHQIEITVTRSLFDRIQLGSIVTVTVLGGSPTGTDPAAQVQIVPNKEYTLHTGDEAIFFVRRTDLAWRSNPPGQPATRPIVQFLTAPRYGYLRKQADGRFHAEDPAEAPMSLAEATQRLQQRPSR